MRDDGVPGVVLVPKAVRNSQVVRELDPRVSRELWGLLLLAAVLVAGLGLYAWPHLALRQTGMQTEQMLRERERLIEEGRKLRLEKSSLENLKRVQSIAERQLGLSSPPPERVIVVEPAQPVPEGTRLARKDAAEAQN